MATETYKQEQNNESHNVTWCPCCC